MGGREKWVRGSLLPDLYARYQARDKRYSSIPVSERQAYLLGCAISTATRRQGGLIWQGRTVYLSSRYGMHLVSFGQTEQEDADFLTRDAEHQARRELESVRAMVRRGKADRIAATLDRYRRELASRDEIAADAEEPDDWRQECADRAAFLRDLIAILEVG